MPSPPAAATNSGDSADYGNDSTVPSTIDGFVKESYDSYDYSAFEGYYLPDSGTDFDYLIIDTNGSRWRIGSIDDLAASGYLQYDADYDCIYAYNEHDGRRLSVLRRRQQREHLFARLVHL